MQANSNAIVEGTSTTSAHPSVGILIDEFNVPHCTGTLIASNVVLTAAHCFDGPSKLNFQLGAFDAKKKAYEPLPSGDEVHPYSVDHPSYDGESHDLAYVVLAEDVPGVTPAQLGSKDDVADHCGFEVVGYGRTTPLPDDGTDGTQTDYQGERKMATICVTGTNPANGFLTATGSDGSTCKGDSGGGLLERGADTDVLVGVVRGSPPGTNCGVGALLWFQPVATETSFVQKALAAGLNPPSPSPADAPATAPAANGDEDDSSTDAP
jgi:secreted trypsin-like serine protease